MAHDQLLHRLPRARLASVALVWAACIVSSAGCSNPATPTSVCSRMISTCMCFTESWRSLCVSTINGYDPTQAQLDCAQNQPCDTLCNESRLVATCYTPPAADAGPPATDAGSVPDTGARADGGPPPDAPAPADSGTSTDSGPVTSDAPTSCSSSVTCGECTTVAGCGWCRNRSECVAGTASGPAGGECSGPQWSPTPASCP